MPGQARAAVQPGIMAEGLGEDRTQAGDQAQVADPDTAMDTAMETDTGMEEVPVVGRVQVADRTRIHRRTTHTTSYTERGRTNSFYCAQTC
jgi:hypothetical protein